MSTLRHRFESFGGILAMEDPPMLVHVDRDFMRSLGHSACSAWQESEESETQPLSAPLEVHLSVTNACSQRCGHCYMDSGQNDAGELSSAELRRAIDLLAEMGVFHVALGGGEALERPDFFELAAHARERGMVPNLTTNGSLSDPGDCRAMPYLRSGQRQHRLPRRGRAGRLGGAASRSGPSAGSRDPRWDQLRRDSAGAGWSSEPHRVREGARARRRGAAPAQALGPWEEGLLRSAVDAGSERELFSVHPGPVLEARRLPGEDRLLVRSDVLLAPTGQERHGKVLGLRV